MKISKDVEPLVREAYAASVAGSAEWFATALDALTSRDEAFAQEALRLALVIDAAALYAVHDQQSPDQEQIAELVESFEETATWTTVQPGAAKTFISALADGTPAATVLPAGDATQLAFMIGGWLLAAFLPDGKDWTDFLDEILDALEAAPATG